MYRDVGHNAESCCSAKEFDEVEWNRAYVVLSDCSLSDPEIRFLVQIQFVKIFLTVLYFCRAFLQLLVDFKTGDFGFFSDSDFNISLQSHLFYKDTKADCWDFRKFIHSLLGQIGTFYVATHKDDMVLAQGFGSSDTSFNIENIGLADNMGVNDLRTDLAFIFPSGTQLYREVTGITKSGTEEIITIDSSLGLAVDPGDCVISWLDKMRLAEDEIEFVWPKAHEMVCNPMLKAVKA